MSYARNKVAKNKPEVNGRKKSKEIFLSSWCGLLDINVKRNNSWS